MQVLTIDGPRIGLLALGSQDGPTLSRAHRLDALGAQALGTTGCWLAQELHGAGVGRPVVSVVTQTVVDAGDPAITWPSKLIGLGRASHDRTRHDAEQLSRRHGWQVRAHRRRAGPRPAPDRLLPLTDVTAVLRVRPARRAGTTVTPRRSSHAPPR